MYDTDCKFSEHCNGKGKGTGHFKLFVIRTDEGVVQVKRLNNNTRIPVRGTSQGAKYNLAAAQTAVCPAHGKYR